MPTFTHKPTGKRVFFAHIPRTAGKLAEAFGQGDLPVKEYTPGEVDDNVADISIMLSTGWKPKINILDTV